jgi:4-aminobutyrate aminotransferase-like enzyme
MTPEIADALSGLTLSTYGGNPVSMAQAYATIQYIEKHRLWENADVQGNALRSFMDEQGQKYDFIGDVRGMGLMQAFEMVLPGTKKPDAARANALIVAARKKGLLIGKGGRYGNVNRIAPHLNVAADDIAKGCELLGGALAEIA